MHSELALKDFQKNISFLFQSILTVLIGALLSKIRKLVEDVLVNYRSFYTFIFIDDLVLMISTVLLKLNNFLLSFLKQNLN
jgi:hypothetical protein